MKVLIADRFEQATIDAIEALGCDVDAQCDVTAEDLPEMLAARRPNVLVVRSKRVCAKSLNATDRLALVVRAGSGTDSIDIAEASRRGIFVANTPGQTATAVAELAWGLILACDRRIPDQVIELRAGRWRRGDYVRSQGLFGRNLGIVGFGRVGREVALRGKAFGMRVIAWSPSLTEAQCDEAGVDYVANLSNLARLADVVSISVAASPATEGLISAKFLNAMRPGAILVNTSRSAVIDEKALAIAVESRGVRCGLDVLSGEPTPPATEFSNPLARLDGVYPTHHVGAQTEQAQLATAAETVRIVRAFVEGAAIPNCVNRAAATPATAILTVRHLNRPGVLAHVFYTLGQAQINVEEMENVIYEGGEAGCAKVHLSRPPSEEHILTIRKNPNVLGTALTLIRKQLEDEQGSRMKDRG